MMKKNSPQLTRLFLLCPVLFCWAVISVQAHEFWIEPVDWNIAQDKETLLSLRVGTAFKGNGVLDLPIEQNRFDVIAPDNSKTPAGVGFAADPAGKMRVTGPGAWRAVFQNKGKETTLLLAKFLPYLQESGLTAEYESLAGKPSSWTVTEEFRRNAVYLKVQDGVAQWPLPPVGLTLELVPQDDPANVGPGGDYRVQALWKGAPLPGRLVYVMTKGKGEKRIAEAWTDQQGIAALPIGKAGPVLINLVHMQKKRFEERSYISDWSSLTVDMR